MIEGNFLTEVPTFLAQIPQLKLTLEWPMYLPEENCSLVIMDRKNVNVKINHERYISMGDFKLQLKQKSQCGKLVINLFDFFGFAGDLNNLNSSFEEKLDMVNKAQMRSHPGVALAIQEKHPQILNMRDKDENTPLLQACRLNNPTLIEKMLQWKIDPNIGKGRKKGTVIHAILKSNTIDMDVFKLILSTF